MRIGVIGAMQIEVDNLKKSMQVEKTEEVSFWEKVKSDISHIID